MIGLHTKFQFLEQPWCNLLLDNRSDQILAYERGLLLFVFNLSPDKAYTDYGIQVTPGKYQVVLDTDDTRFGGFGNVDHSMTYYPQRMGGISGSNWLKLYLPPRIALVFKRIPPPSIYEV
jgi:1,4-alpha-glucan branching enzyme